MKRAMLIQHESFEALGTLDPVLKREGVRIRYVNFERAPDAVPSLEKVDALILMGGYMGVYESHKYAHLKVEMKLIEEALKLGTPILGICLGSQILAHVLGADVRKHTEREMGWYPVNLTDKGRADPILADFATTETLFQSHGDTFDIPVSAEHLAWSELCASQAFRYGKAYGLQFHLEIDQPTIAHWLAMPENREIFEASGGRFDPARIEAETQTFLPRSLALSEATFTRFVSQHGGGKRVIRLGSGHGKS